MRWKHASLAQYSHHARIGGAVGCGFGLASKARKRLATQKAGGLIVAKKDDG